MLHQSSSRLLYAFLFIVTLLSIIGIIFIYSSSSVFALERFGCAHYFVKKQVVGIICGLFGLLIARLFPLDWLERLTPFIFGITLALTSLTLTHAYGQTVHGSARWLCYKGIGVQPSEFLKMALILYVARLIAQQRTPLPTRGYLGRYLFILTLLGVTALVLLYQPDFGQTVALSVTIILMLFIAQTPLHYLACTAALSIPLGVGLIVHKAYRLRRILTFLNPWQDPQGAGFQIIQSLIAIGSGGLWGVGIGQSKQKFFYLPMQHTDFIFSIIAEEVGFIGSALVIGLFGAFLYTGFKLAWRMQRPFACYATLGFVILITVQALINMFVTTGLLPTKGIGLPFISYGKSALIANLCMLGIIIQGAQE